MNIISGFFAPDAQALALKDGEIATLKTTIHRLEADKIIMRRRNAKLENETAQAQYTKDAVKSNEESRLREMDKRSGALDAKEYQIQTLKSEARADQATIRGLRCNLEVSVFEITDVERLRAEAEIERDGFEAELHQARDEIVTQAGQLDAALNEQTNLRTTINRLQEQVRRLQRRLNGLLPAQWAPSPESELRNNLGALKETMRGWTRGFATERIAPWNRLDAEGLTKLSNSLPRVGIFANGIPAGLGESIRGPALLLNALLAHDIYTKVLAGPFSSITGSETENTLANFYNTLKDFKLPLSAYSNTSSRFTSNPDIIGRSPRSIESEKEVHSWRSQTLRLLNPTSVNFFQNEADLLQTRNDRMRIIANSRAQQFLDTDAPGASMAITFMNDALTADQQIICLQRLEEVYYQAAQVAYNLWTRKQTFKVSTRADMGPVNFDSRNLLMEVHPNVRVNNHPGQLQGRPVTLIMHPLLEVIGTHEGEDFDQEPRVLMPAEVWLDSSLPAGPRRRRRQPAPAPPANPQPPPPPPPGVAPAGTGTGGGGGSGGGGPGPVAPVPVAPPPVQNPAPDLHADEDTATI